MDKMHNYWNQIFDLKVSIAALLFGIVSLSDLGETVKIVGGLIFIGYNVRRWVIMEIKYKKNNSSEDETN